MKLTLIAIVAMLATGCVASKPERPDDFEACEACEPEIEPYRGDWECACWTSDGYPCCRECALAWVEAGSVAAFDESCTLCMWTYYPEDV